MWRKQFHCAAGELKGAVKFVNVDFKILTAIKNTLSDFTLDVKPGESIALVGESGAGKSTVLNLLIGFILRSGKILIDGINMVNLDINEYRHQIAVVPQKYNPVFRNDSGQYRLRSGTCDGKGRWRS